MFLVPFYIQSATPILETDYHQSLHCRLEIPHIPLVYLNSLRRGMKSLIVQRLRYVLVFSFHSTQLIF